eukprot:3587-Eustigmatos_ZCMA.PRE.1
MDGSRGVDPTDLKWLLEAEKAQPTAVLEALSCSYALQVLYTSGRHTAGICAQLTKHLIQSQSYSTK